MFRFVWLNWFPKGCQRSLLRDSAWHVLRRQSLLLCFSLQPDFVFEWRGSFGAGFFDRLEKKEVNEIDAAADENEDDADGKQVLPENAINCSSQFEIEQWCRLLKCIITNLPARSCHLQQRQHRSEGEYAEKDSKAIDHV